MSHISTHAFELRVPVSPAADAADADAAAVAFGVLAAAAAERVYRAPHLSALPACQPAAWQPGDDRVLVCDACYVRYRYFQGISKRSKLLCTASPNHWRN